MKPHVLHSRHRLAAVAAVVLLTALPALALAQVDTTAVSAGSATIETPAARIIVSAVDPGVFHVVAFAPDLAAPPLSPFVVETQPSAAASIERDAHGATRITTADATFAINATGHFRVSNAAGHVLLDNCEIATSQSAPLSVTLTHNPADQFYGAGNQNRNVSGDLAHPNGNEKLANGTTRIPFLWSPAGYGMLMANNISGISWADTQGAFTWSVPGAYVDLYVIVATDGYGLLDAYSRLTGRAPIPPKWSFGYMQSRWGYSGADDIQEKWHHFRDNQIPVDAFIYDYDWFSNDWEFNQSNFPPGSLAAMKKLGLHFVGIRKPRANGANLDFAKSQSWILVRSDLQYDLPEVRYWWWSKHAPLVDAGVDGWWNDEAEQSYDEFFRMSQAEWDGWRSMSTRRAWSISRAFAPGQQRFGAAAWTGDITSTWDTFANQPGELLNWGDAGMPYVSQDLGGFKGSPSPELYTRWIESGVFEPVFRSHGSFNSNRWPWAFGDEALDATRKAIDLRYRLIPYIYTLAAQTSQYGAPIMRPLLLEFPNDRNTSNLKDEWLLGSRLLAAPILTEGGTRSVYLPAGRWYDFNTGKAVGKAERPTTLHVNAALDVIPAYVRSGSIVPLGPVMQYTSQAPEDPIEIRVYPGSNATFSLYEDGGDDYSYQNGKSSLIPFSWLDSSKTLTIQERTGSFDGMLPVRHFNVVLPGGRTKSVTYTGQPISVAL
jgi:alpha-glucosidase